MSFNNISLKKAESVSYIIASMLGVLFHFVYEWSGSNSFLGLFFPVNESTWEHLKLIFYPVIITSIIEYYLFHIQNTNYICIKLRSSIIAIISTITIFYTYSGIIGRTIDWINIAIFFIAMAIAYIHSYHRLSDVSVSRSKISSTGCIIVIAIISILFMIFTVYPPAIGLFAPPV